MAQMTIDANVLSSAWWAGDFLNPEHLIPGGAKVDAAQWEDGTPYTVMVDDAAAAQGDTALGVEALLVALPVGAVLDFGEHGSGWQMLAKVATAAAVGATALTVEPLSGAIEDDAEATYYDATNGTKPIVAGTLIGRTFAERIAGTALGPAATDGSDDEVFLVAFDVSDAVQGDDVELYRPGSVVKEEMLPDWSDYTANLKAQLRATYICTSGQD